MATLKDFCVVLNTEELCQLLHFFTGSLVCPGTPLTTTSFVHCFCWVHRMCVHDSAAQLERSSVEAVWESGTVNRRGDRERSLTLITGSLGLRQLSLPFCLFLALSFSTVSYGFSFSFSATPSIQPRHHTTHTTIH